MFKKLVVCLFLLIFALPGSVHASTGTGEVLRVLVNEEVAAAVPKPLSVSGTPLVPLRAVTEHIGGAVRWDAAKKSAQVIYDGRQHTLNGTVQNGSLMVFPGQIGHIFDMQTHYDASVSAVSFTQDNNAPDRSQLMALLPSYDGYNADDLHWLSRIVEAEARGESYESRLAVANVVLNRRAAPQYPDTIKDVIFDRKHGVQFTPTINGAIEREPGTLSYLAAMDALDGYNNAPGALFFLSPELATCFWIQKNRQFAYTIGGHAYYY